jgi:hypothetical protein
MEHFNMDENRISDLPFVLYELPFERLHWSPLA